MSPWNLRATSSAVTMRTGVMGMNCRAVSMSPPPRLPRRCSCIVRDVGRRPPSALIPVHLGWAGAFSGVALSIILGVPPPRLPRRCSCIVRDVGRRPPSALIPVHLGWAGAFSGVALSIILGVKPLIHAPAVENAPSQPHSHSPTLPLAIFSTILHSEASKRRLIWRGK